MTDTEHEALNAEYAVACKGWRRVNESGLEQWRLDHDNGAVWIDEELPDYLSNDAELGRMVKALVLHKHDPHWVNLKDEGKRIILSTPAVETYFYGASVNECAMRACIALKVQVSS